MPHRPRLPISARHAFALAFDLAARRDWLHSIAVPLLLWSPWIFAPAVVELAFPRLERSQLLLATAGCKLNRQCVVEGRNLVRELHVHDRPDDLYDLAYVHSKSSGAAN